MNVLLQNLLRLQDLEFGGDRSKKIEEEMAGLRTKIPPQILAHYARLVARGKKGVAVVRNQVCTGCYMRLPIGTVNTLMQATDIQLCDTCGRYLYLVPVTVEPAAEEKPAKAKAGALGESALPSAKAKVKATPSPRISRISRKKPGPDGESSPQLSPPRKRKTPTPAAT